MRIVISVVALACVTGMATPPPPEPEAVETPALETPGLETPGLETPALETPALETPGLETPAPEAAPPPPPLPVVVPPKPVPKARTLRPGDHGQDVRRLQRVLKRLRYPPGPISGRYGPSTKVAVWAFQKVHRLRVNGVVSARVWRALAHPVQPRAFAPNGPGERVEVDLRRQLLRLYGRGRLVLVSHISSGSGRYYCSEGVCDYATTPTGRFSVYRKIRGAHVAPLGTLYNPLFFRAGWAMHGSLSVPLYPASHGCVRLPMHISLMVFRTVTMGERVYIRR